MAIGFAIIITGVILLFVAMTLYSLGDEAYKNEDRFIYAAYAATGLAAGRRQGAGQ